MGMKIDTINSLVNGRNDRRVVAAQKGLGTFVTIDIGFTRTGIDARAPLHLWVHLCDWVLREGPNEILSSDRSESDKYAEALRRLVGTRLEEVLSVEPDNGLLIRFSSLFTLELSPNPGLYSDSDDMLLIYAKGSEPVGYSVDRGFYQEYGSD